MRLYAQTVIDILSDADEAVVEAFHRLLPQLDEQPPELTAEFVRSVVTYPANLVLAARAGQRVVGLLLTLVVLALPTGITALFEDVVVDEAARGAGIGWAFVRRPGAGEVPRSPPGRSDVPAEPRVRAPSV
ncbi:hypothetical protein ACIQ7Q_31495 [Streptomyces sp. NPDC096176]|uniref:hypothetical protein n=1 Tax=Streptomyces sp. NPDC096176 TaxID=3366079 RepID=UPI0037F8E863